MAKILIAEDERDIRDLVAFPETFLRLLSRGQNDRLQH